MSFLKRIEGLTKRPRPVLRQAADCQSPLQPEASAAWERQELMKTLTPREQEVYTNLIRGLKMREIAELLGIAYPTVNFHCKGLYRKLRVNTRAQLFAQYAMFDGWANSQDEVKKG